MLGNNRSMLAYAAAAAFLCLGMAANGAPLAAATGTVTPTQKFGTVTLQFYRHGESCSNVLSRCTYDEWCPNYEEDPVDASITSTNPNTTTVLSVTVQLPNGTVIERPVLPDARRPHFNDSFLDNWGVEHSKSAGQNLSADVRNPDMVMASSLTRAIETALYMFPHAPAVYPVPYVKEDGEGSNCTPDITEQRAVLAKYDDAEANATARVKYEYFFKQELDMNCYDALNASAPVPRFMSNYTMFLGFLSDALAQGKMHETVMRKFRSGQNVDIAVVSHGDFIFEQILKWDDDTHHRLYNNQGFQMRFTFEFDPAINHNNNTSATNQNGKLVQTETEWQQIISATGSPKLCKAKEGVRHAVASDLDRCFQRYTSVQYEQYAQQCML